MRHPVALLVLALLVTLSVHDAGAADNKAAMERLRSNPDIEMFKETDKAVPQFISGKLSSTVNRGQEVTAALAFLTDHKQAYRMTDPQKEMVLDRVETDRLGMTHVRFDQYYQGVRVYAAGLKAHYDAENNLSTVNGFYMPDIKVETVPTVSGTRAVEIAGDDLAGFFGTGRPDAPELIVFEWEGRYHLAWRTTLWSDSPMGRWEYFVDAKSGDVIFKANRIMDANDIGTGTGVMGNPRNHIDTDYNGSVYRMLDYTRLSSNDPHGHGGQMPDGSYIQTNIAGGSLPGVLATDADNVWDDYNTQAAAVDGHVYSALMYDYMLDAFGRNSFDDAGSFMLTSVGYYAEGYNNAYWNGYQIVVWAPGGGALSLAGSPDVIAHEWGHAVTDYTSDLVYQKESGALNESFSDMIGAAFEFAHDTMDVPDWQIGENISVTSSGFRSMQNPPWAGDPDIYETSPYWIDVQNCSPSYTNDYCGVHTNSGVGNKWFYLLSDGDSFNGVTVNGIGVQNAMQIAYRANQFYWSALSDYPDAAYGTIVAANDLDPSGVWTDEVLLAWDAVGVPIPEPALVVSPAGVMPEVFPYDTPPVLSISTQGIYGGVQLSGTGQMHYSIDGGSYSAIPMTETTPGTYEVTMPSVDCGSVISFYFSVEETTSGTFYTPDPGSPLQAYPYTDVITVDENDLSSDPGWTIQPAWSYGQPTGGGGAYGGPDPTSGYTGNNVYGYNLSGDYPNNLPERNLTTDAIDCSGMTNTRLRFQRWLGVEQPIYDHAYVRVSNNGSTWVTVWENETEIADNAWVPMDIDISAVADNESSVYVRWTMGASDGGWTYCGWNIDDIEVVSLECSLWLCGDLNDDGNITLSDISRLIDYVYISKVPPDPIEPANVNGSPDEKVTLSDITRLIDHVYISKAPLECL